MRSLAKKMNQEAVSAELCCGQVMEVRGQQITVEDGRQRFVARRAAGCLLAPAPGDEVLVAHTSDGRSLVTCVLDRQEGAPSRLELDGDVELRAPRGRVDLAARDGMSLRTARRLDLTAAELGLTAAVGKVVVDRLNLAGRVATAAWDRVRLAAESTDTVVGRALQRFKIRSCKVEEVDQQQAKMLHQEVDQLHALQSGHMVMRAKNEIRVDGKQIIMG